MKKIEICPFCNKDLPLSKSICACGAYRVNDENYNKSFKEIYGFKR